MNIKDMPEGEYEKGYIHGAQAFASSLINAINEGESMGVPFNAVDYKLVINNCIKQMKAPDLQKETIYDFAQEKASQELIPTANGNVSVSFEDESEVH